MQITVKNKLIVLGVMTVVSLSMLAGLMYAKHSEIKSMRALSINSQSHLQAIDNSRLMRMQLGNAYYASVIGRNGTEVSATNMNLIEQSSAGLKKDFKILMDDPAPYLEDRKIEEVATLADDLIQIVRVQMPRLVAIRADDAEFKALSAKVEEKRAAMNAIQEDMFEKTIVVNNKAKADATHAIEAADTALMIIYVLALIVMLPLLSGLSISIIRALRKSTDVANSLATGDYKVAIDGLDSQDEIGDLLRSLNSIKDTIADYSGQIGSIQKSQAVIEYTLDGVVMNANDNFLNAMCYSMSEIKGKHHSMFVDSASRDSSEYREFWSKLNRGEYQSGEYRRIGKGSREVWIQSTYNPILDPAGKPFKIVEYATEITKAKLESINGARLKLALDNCTSNVMMADADFNIIYMNGAVTDFLQEAEKDIQKELPRFSIANMVGSNIDIFHKNPSHQRSMLEKLTDTYRTSIHVGGRSFNLVANPVFGVNKERLGTVVEWQDGTALGLTEALNRSQAIIEFSTTGIILDANSNFLTVMGYNLDEIKGKHHSIFADAAYTASPEYRKFWEDLNRGEAQSGEFKRLGKGGKVVWINASYNPIVDLRGKVVRVVKTAIDITQMVLVRTENEIGMNEAVKILTGVAEGNLMKKMEWDYKGTFSDIKKAVNSTVDRLYGMVKQITESAQAVNSASGEIASGSTDLSQRTEEQASSLEETAASMEEITGTVKQNSQNAATANELSAKANQAASDGGKVVEDAVVAMGSIEKSSQKISDIIGVIDEIAFQTNLLALNAAVEAARAGDAGKGFAVVASEVRSLAGRSASASKEIKTLINESAQQVKTGATLVNQAGDTLKNIVSSVKQVSGIVSEIATASQEQATGIDEINTAIAQMDEVTQQNAALVEENTAAATSMVEQAREMERLMSFFKISEKEEGMDMMHARTASGDMPTAMPRNKTVTPVKSTPRPVTSMASHKSDAGKSSAKGSADKDWKVF